MMEDLSTDSGAAKRNASPALQTFVENLGRLRNLLDLLKESTEQTGKDIANLREQPLQSLDDARNRDENLKQLEARIANNGIRMAIYLEWQCVMAVTFTETYLQDVLAYFAGLDSDLMAESEQTASYTEILSASSLEELAMEMRGGWARKLVDRGGPTRWLQRLQKMGASNLRNFQVDSMEELWGIRHLIIHRAGKRSRDFQRRHPHVSFSMDGHINISDEMASTYLNTIGSFVIETESFLQRRHSARHTSNSN